MASTTRAFHGQRARWKLPSLSLESRVALLAVVAGAPGTILVLVLLWSGALAMREAAIVTVAMVCMWIGLPLAARRRLIGVLRTLQNLLAAFGEGDYSMRVRAQPGAGAYAAVVAEANLMADLLKAQRAGAADTASLARVVMHELDVPLFAFDHDDRLRVVNRAGERLLGGQGEGAIGRHAATLGLETALRCDPHTTVTLSSATGARRWSVRRTHMRQAGLPHTLVVLIDLDRELRRSELDAWRRLVRVLGHELNNSLTPIISITDTLERSVQRLELPDRDRVELVRRLSVVSARARSLHRFLDGYSRLSRLPAPHRQSMELASLVDRVQRLVADKRIAVRTGALVMVMGDADQLEQALINLVRNALDAVGSTDGRITITWSVLERSVELCVIDEGIGLPDGADIFVPFFSTKADGSGIGLVLSRQIAEAHGGTLALENRTDRGGCVARMHLPLVDD